MMGAIDIEEDAEAVAGQHPVPTKTRWFEMWHYLGRNTRKSLQKLENNDVKDKNYKEALKALTKYFAPTLNRIYQMHVLAEIKQGETLSTQK